MILQSSSIWSENQKLCFVTLSSFPYSYSTREKGERIKGMYTKFSIFFFGLVWISTTLLCHFFFSVFFFFVLNQRKGERKEFRKKRENKVMCTKFPFWHCRKEASFLRAFRNTLKNEKHSFIYRFAGSNAIY